MGVYGKTKTMKDNNQEKDFRENLQRVIIETFAHSDKKTWPKLKKQS